MERYYAGIDLHSNNNVIVIIDGQGKVVRDRRVPNEIQEVLKVLEPYKGRLEGIVVESTYNWYWLVDGLMERGFDVSLANTNAIKQYSGLKHTNDKSDARWLAEMLRLNILPKGYIYPKAERGVRDLLRKRMRLVQCRTRHILSIKGLINRQLGIDVGAQVIQKKLDDSTIQELFSDPSLALSASSSLAPIRCLEQQIKRIEDWITPRVKIKPEYQGLITVDGIGKILAATISLETGDINRFEKVGDFSSYCRCVKSDRYSNNKKKGKNNTKNGNKYLSWAFIEAAQGARRYNPLARRYYQRKAAKRKAVIARKALANKLARACYYIMRDQVPFDAMRAFG